LSAASPTKRIPKVFTEYTVERKEGYHIVKALFAVRLFDVSTYLSVSFTGSVLVLVREFYPHVKRLSDNELFRSVFTTLTLKRGAH